MPVTAEDHWSSWSCSFTSATCSWEHGMCQYQQLESSLSPGHFVIYAQKHCWRYGLVRLSLIYLICKKPFRRYFTAATMYALANHNGAKHDHYRARIALVLLPTSAYRCIGPSPTTSSRRSLVRHITVLHFFLFLLLVFYFHTLVVTVPRSLVRILARMDTHHALFFLVKHVRHIECTIRVWPHKITCN